MKIHLVFVVSIVLGSFALGMLITVHLFERSFRRECASGQLKGKSCDEIRRWR